MRKIPLFFVLLCTLAASPNAGIWATESNIRGLDHEEAYIFSRSGAVLAHYVGTASAVPIPDADLDRFAGAILTHNHPRSSALWTFSIEDISVAARMRLYEIRVVAYNNQNQPFLCKMTLEGKQIDPLYPARYLANFGGVGAANAQDAMWKQFGAKFGVFYGCTVEG